MESLKSMKSWSGEERRVTDGDERGDQQRHNKKKGGEQERKLENKLLAGARYGRKEILIVERRRKGVRCQIERSVKGENRQRQQGKEIAMLW